MCSSLEINNLNEYFHNQSKMAFNQLSKKEFKNCSIEPVLKYLENWLAEKNRQNIEKTKTNRSKFFLGDICSAYP